MISEKSHVLVTGGAGFIGSHLVEHLIELGATVTVMDSLSTSSLNNLQPVVSQIEWVIGDLGDLLRWQKIDLNQFDFIFHLAANPYIPSSVENPVFDFNANLNNTFLLLISTNKVS